MRLLMQSSRMSSIRLFILGSLEQHGPMHGHQLRLLAEREHIDTWTNITVGSLFDLALIWLDSDHLDDFPAMIDARWASLRAMLADNDAHLTAIRRYLSVSEVHATEHRQVRLRAEIAWHESLLAAIPAIIEDERARHQEGRFE